MTRHGPEKPPTLNRESLAADLREHVWYMGNPNEALLMAGRLEALGWRNVRSPEFVEALTRALILVDIESVVGGNVLEWWRMGPKPLATLIAKALMDDGLATVGRENTDA